MRRSKRLRSQSESFTSASPILVADCKRRRVSIESTTRTGRAGVTANALAEHYSNLQILHTDRAIATSVLLSFDRQNNVVQNWF